MFKLARARAIVTVHKRIERAINGTLVSNHSIARTHTRIPDDAAAAAAGRTNDPGVY